MRSRPPCIRIERVWLEQPTQRMQDTGRAHIRIVTDEGEWRREVTLDEHALRSAWLLADRHGVQLIIAHELEGWASDRMTTAEGEPRQKSIFGGDHAGD